MIHDTSDMGYKNMDNNIMWFVTNFTQILQDYYCERLAKAYIVGVNWMFKPVLYALEKCVS